MAKTKNYHLEIVGKRLLHIRSELNLNKSKMATQCGLDLVAYRRLENGEGCSADNLLTLMNELTKLKYNINWLVTNDNTAISRKDEEMFFFAFDREKAVSDLKDMEKIIQSMKSKLKNV